MLHTRKAALLSLFLIPGVLLLGGCGSGSGTTFSSPNSEVSDTLVGTWRLVRSTGGKDDLGFTPPIAPLYETFDQAGTVTQSGGGVANAQQKYTVVYRKSRIVGGDTFVPVIEYTNASVAQVIVQLDDTTLRLTEDRLQGYTLFYTREGTGK